MSAEVKSWADHIAVLATDALIDAGLVHGDDLNRAVETISNEIFARLCLSDFPPAEEPRG